MYTSTMQAIAQIEASALRRDLFSILSRLEAGETIQITRHGRPVALMAPSVGERKSEKPKISPRRLARLCHRHHIQKLALFGSILRDDFGPDSDVDVLIDPKPGHMKTFGEREAARLDLVKLFGRPVDLLKRSVVKNSNDTIRKESILSSARVIYGA